MLTPRSLKRLQRYRDENNRIRQVVARLKKPTRPIASRAQLLCEARRYLNRDFLDILRVQMHLQPLRKHGRRWPVEFRQFALNLYFTSPKAYRYLSTILSLPTVKSLRTWLSDVLVKPGILPQILDFLKETKKGKCATELFA